MDGRKISFGCFKLNAHQVWGMILKFTSKEKIIILLYRKRWSQARLAGRVFISTSTLSRILHDSSRAISEDELAAFAKAFGISLDELRDDKWLRKATMNFVHGCLPFFLLWKDDEILSIFSSIMKMKSVLIRKTKGEKDFGR